MTRVLITGAAGFVGSWLAREFAHDHDVVAMTRPGSQNLDRLSDLDDIEIIPHDISQPWPDIPGTDVVLHAGGDASSENCIRDPWAAITVNALGTLQALEFARRNRVRHFVYYSTGEVFGAVTPGDTVREDAAYACTTPYAATKAAGAELVRSYHHCHGVRASVIHINNTFGPASQSNRFPVIVMRAVLRGTKITIHQDSQGRIASRRWFPVQDVASHTRWILDHQQQGFERWNSAGARAIDNLEFAGLIAQAAGTDLDYEIQESTRPGHTACYDIDPHKLYESGWRESHSIHQRISDTLRWYKQNPQWLERK